MKNNKYSKIAVLFLLLGSLFATGCRASLDVGNTKSSSDSQSQEVVA